MKLAASCRSRSLFGTLSLGLFRVLVVQIVLALGLVLVLVLWPLTQQSAESRAGLMVLAVQTWLELPQDTRADFVQELDARHGLLLRTGCEHLPEPNVPWASYPAALQRALFERLRDRDDPEPVVALSPDRAWVVACIHFNGQAFAVRFAAPHLLEGRLLALGLILLISSLLAGLLALVLARRVAGPLERMTHSVQTWGAHEPVPLPVTANDVFEVCTLARTLEHMHQRLHSHERARTTLLAGISHDLRTPLARMRLALEMLPDEASHGLRAGLVRDVEAMDALIAQTLQLARAGQGGATDNASLSVESLDLMLFAQALVEDARRGGMQLSLHGEPCRATLAPLALERILLNLLDNAWRYSGHRPVDLVLHCKDGLSCFEVLDRGTGIPESMREDVFHPFVRLESSRNQNSGGSGLGLAIARQLAEAQGWTMGIEAREGGGTCAWLRLQR